MRVISLGSGSSGNAVFVEAGPQGRTKVLVDAGLNGRMLCERLRSVGVEPAQLQGVLVTHEHSDHVSGLPYLLKRYTFPIVADPRTYRAIVEGIASGAWRNDSGSLTTIANERNTVLPNADVFDMAALESVTPSADVALSVENNQVYTRNLPLRVGSTCMLGDIEITSFPISHDALAPCGYLLSAGGCRVCVVTDSGDVSVGMIEKMRQADLLILESNHDRQRLLRGPYPQSLKMRIVSDTGHLSNDQAADAVLRTWRSDGVRWLWLAHLSRTNNTPALALKSMRSRLQDAGVQLAHIHISVSPPGMGNVWDSTQLWHAPSLWNMNY